ncbi:unnamed protein product [Dibothriocephalus latus]|uniref:Fibronectin type-III domain-containing protein n=1 Tax=Dibothriocephalus latus TaxID=60516 RepID=A0A3P7L5B7_DIBLA|nr:unnamed protein product [Dibothriocephalus latus]
MYAPGRVTSYRCVLYSGSLPTQWKTVKAKSVRFYGLDANRLYRVGVSATISPLSPNLGGGTGPETLSDFDEDSTKPVPSAPQNVKATLIKPTEVKVVWTEPKYKGSGVAGYQITVRWGGDVVKDAKVVVKGTSCIARNLPEFAELVFAVTATSAKGTGEAGLSNSVYTQATGK